MPEQAVIVWDLEAVPELGGFAAPTIGAQPLTEKE
jgi:hypothetical protein